MKTILLIFVTSAVVAAVIYGVVITKDRDALNTELQSVQGTLSLTQSNLDSMQAELASTQSELSSTRQTLTSTQAELSSTKQTLGSMQAELASTQSELSYVQQASTNLQAIYSTTQQQLTVAQETLSGLGITLYASKQCRDVGLIDNPTAENPTWNQLIAFLSLDQTEKHTYIIDEYDCSQFSRDVHNNAEAAGIRTAEVQVWFRGESTGHALNAFLTTDCGLVFIDCTGEPDKIARVITGKEYQAVKVSGITGEYIRDDEWWDALGHALREYYSISGVTKSIRIYW